MMNYIVLNGQKSTEIPGLLIQSLPPISKPLMRTMVEEIDGRDGDIVTKLGYSAYDKELLIGLHGDFDIDSIIQYFDSDGTVIFSNEPDKYYNYQILAQIDFERLIRFRTATVTLHCQPFKYSALAAPYKFIQNKLNVPDYTATKNGITLTAQGGKIAVSGTGTAATEFYVPITALNLPAGNFTLSAETSGDRSSTSSIRLIGSVPSDADSFGGTYLPLPNNSYATLPAVLTAAKTFNYVWFYITAGTAMDYTVSVEVTNDNEKSVTIRNAGNIFSKPQITIYGSGTINLFLNGFQIFSINLGNDEYITIDAAAMEAYKDTPDNLKNRLVTGDYDNLALQIGKNTLSWDGNVNEIDVANYSRWI